MTCLWDPSIYILANIVWQIRTAVLEKLFYSARIVTISFLLFSITLNLFTQNYPQQILIFRKFPMVKIKINPYPLSHRNIWRNISPSSTPIGTQLVQHINPQLFSVQTRQLNKCKAITNTLELPVMGMDAIFFFSRAPPCCRCVGTGRRHGGASSGNGGSGAFTNSHLRLNRVWTCVRGLYLVDE